VMHCRPLLQVMAVNSGGTFAEECVVSQHAAWKVPGMVSAIQCSAAS
jgi:D-arabinose 1-dehydrogenase-like Zn-dependent alcohol dehydrogenase